MHSVTIRDIKNNPATMVSQLEKGNSVFLTKHGKAIGVTIPLDDSIIDKSVKEILYFDLYKKGEISFGKLAQLLGVRKSKLRKMFASMNMPVIDYNPKEITQELEILKDL